MPCDGRPFHLLEINVISAQDLAPVSKSMRAYAVVWLHQERKLTTKVDQRGHVSPHWNEKFVFRVDDTFLNADSSAIMIEIYAAAWLRDVQIGTVRVLVRNLFPSHNNSSKMHFVSLQIRRPSGRPQGILKMGVQIVENTMRSMPMLTELSASAIGFEELISAKKNDKQGMKKKIDQLRRSKSDRTEMTTQTDDYGVNGRGRRGCSVVGGGSLISSILKLHNKENDNGNGGNCNGSMVNGSLCSDVGPSASVVAAAIAKGLIQTPGNADGAGSSILDDWTENDSVEGLRTKLERWRAELSSDKDRDNGQEHSKSSRQRRNRMRTDGRGLFSCFSNVFGIEISITCGKGRKKKRYGNGKVYHLGSVSSQS
ncbi:hypothetical protein K2173_015298 [Erythroxylum novogranatense]|uniref:C2 domain-containing protein n=1 Tax=Erythroxylum novogranatense TaxID=1862640 RepID=A0AAV8T1I9_9ROSI|nr:hypothetical protein K2173_015298 [Erythroxylum novogranatense]